MSTQLHGLEVLRLASELVDPSSNSNAYIKTSSIGTILQGVSYDYVGVSENSTQKIYTFKSGGSSGTTNAVVTLTYSDFAGGTLISVEKT
jgi:hypothetical protein